MVFITILNYCNSGLGLLLHYMQIMLLKLKKCLYLLYLMLLSFQCIYFKNCYYDRMELSNISVTIYHFLSRKYPNALTYE